MTTASFDLVERPWLPVLLVDGTEQEVSLSAVFTRAHQIRRLVGELPTQQFAMLRMLLAILHRALDGPRDQASIAALWSAPRLPAAAVVSYLARVRHRFDLLHPTVPFGQVADLATKTGRVAPLNALIADVPTGHQYFTERRGELRLTFSEAARWVVHCHAYDTDGIKAGAVGDPRVKAGKGYPIGPGWLGWFGAVYPEGATLRETLLLNLIPHSDPDDLPAWERPPVGPAADPPEGRRPTGPLDLYTWQTRRIRLHHAGGLVTGVLVSNGDPLHPRGLHDIEPHAAWRHAPTTKGTTRAGAMPILPRDPLWSGLPQLLPHAAPTITAGDAPPATPDPDQVTVVRPPAVLAGLAERGLDPDTPIRLCGVGVTWGTHMAVITDIVADTLTVRASLFTPAGSHTASAAVTATLAGLHALAILASDLVAAAGGGPEHGRGAGDRAREQATTSLDVPLRHWLRALRPADAPEHLRDWHTQAATIISRIGVDLVNADPRPTRVRRGTGLATPQAAERFDRLIRRAFPLAYPPAHGTGADTGTGVEAGVEGSAGGTALQFSSSPRMTWLWAPDAQTAAQVRRYGWPAHRRGEELPLVTDIGIGVEAYDACQALAEAGFTFTWHESVHPLDRAGWPAELPGMTTAGTR